MKSIMYKILLILILILMAFASCKRHLIFTPRLKGEVVFSYQGSKALNKTTAGTLSEMMVSIEGVGGLPTYNAQNIRLYNFSGELISEPLSLVEGTYTLTKFMIVDNDGNVLYATPIADSPYARLVDNPLPIEFDATGETVTKLIPEVITTVDGTPEDFGYSSFGVDIIDIIKFEIIVYSSDGSGQISADLDIKGDSNTLYTGTIGVEAGPDTITILDGYTNYSVNVAKKKYVTYNYAFTADSLRQYCRDLGPLEIVLQKK